jgi:hypothetical protein
MAGTAEPVQESLDCVPLQTECHVFASRAKFVPHPPPD